MHMIVRCFLIFTFLALGTANAVPKYSEDGVTADFRAMLANPHDLAKAGEDFTTHVTRPFVAHTNKDTRIFSNPKNWRVNWAEDYNAPTPLKILETMGISRRGILNDTSAMQHKEITAEQQIGMLKIITGDLGFRKRAATEAEKEIMVRELLNLGRSRDSEGYALQLQTLFDDAKSSAAIKRHAQLSALLMLMGSGGQIRDGEWYLTGLGKPAVLAKIKGYADRFLPREDATAPATPKDVISALMYNGKLQTIYGTPGIRVSGLHAGAGMGRYPDIMVLGSHKIPMQSAHQVFSITAEVAPERYVVIMEPEVGDDPVLRPQYMEVKAADPSSGQGTGKTNVAVKHTGVAEQSLTIDWTVDAPKAGGVALPSAITGLPAYIGSRVSEVKPTEKRLNDGSIKPVVIANAYGEESYSFIARVLSAKEKRFFYWCPTPLQLDRVKEFAGQRKHFTFGELYDHLGTFGDDAVDPRILKDITQIKEGTLVGFSK